MAKKTKDFKYRLFFERKTETKPPNVFKCFDTLEEVTDYIKNSGRVVKVLELKELSDDDYRPPRHLNNYADTDFSKNYISADRVEPNTLNLIMEGSLFPSEKITKFLEGQGKEGDKYQLTYRGTKKITRMVTEPQTETVPCQFNRGFPTMEALNEFLKESGEVDKIIEIKELE